ncbi:MAG: ATP-binding protein [Chloroflexota bacterium]
MNLHSLRTRLFLIFLGMMVFAVLLVAIFARRGTFNEFNRLLARNFRRDQALIGELLQDRVQNNDFTGAQRLAESVEDIYRRPLTLVDEDGTILVDSDQDRVGTTWVSSGERRANGRSYHYSLTDDNSVAFTPPDIPAGAFGRSNDQRGGNIQAGQNSNEQSFIGTISRFFWVIAATAVFIAGASGLALAQRILKPVTQLNAAAQQMAKGDLSQRVAVSSKDELGELSQSFNQMAAGLQQQEQLRRNMVSDIAHELRTPLSNIRGYLEAVQDGVLEPDTDTINSLHEESLLLNRLIADLQELSLAEAGQLKLYPAACDMAALVNQTVQSVQLSAAEKEIALVVELPDKMPDVQGDGERILQILRNLLRNGVAYTPHGGEIRTTAVIHPTELEISISDTGHGIAPEHLPHLFDRFYRADKSRNRSTGGTGLGLAITKALLELQNGRIWVNSTLGQGTTFTFTLPRAIA